MTDNTDQIKTPEISFEQSKAILRVAYLLAAVDGKISEEEKSLFRDTMKQLFGERYTGSDVMTYLEDVSEEAKNLISLRDFYTDDEIVNAFAVKSAESVTTIVHNAYATRCAFAIWISICCSDKDYSKVERLAVTQLQKMVNPKPFLNKLKDGKLLGVTSAAATVATLSGLGLVLPLATVGLLASAVAMSGVGDSITDAFLDDIEKRVKKIGEIHAKMEAASSVAIKQNYKDMYDFEVENFKEFLLDNE